MVEKHTKSLPLWFFQNFLPYKEIGHFVSTRNGGFSNPPYNSLNLGFHVGDNPEIVLKNRERLASVLGIKLSNFTTANQIHGCNVAVITGAARGKGAFHYDIAVPATDAMVTSIPNICLMLLQADCVPVLFFDLKNKVIGAAHAGWRGTVLKIVQHTIRVLQDRFNCLPENILVGIGPSIGPCCYEVGPEIIDQIGKVFHNKEGYVDNNILGSTGYFNLWEANKMQLMEMGIPEKNIEIAQICTCCNHHLFYSYRHQQKETGRFGAGIILNSFA